MLSYKDSVAKVENAKKKLDVLQDIKASLLAKYEAAKQQYLQLKKEAEENYGTSDVEKLRALLTQITAENEKKAVEFENAVNEFEIKINTIANAIQNVQ